MAFTPQSPAAIEAEVLAEFANRFVGKDTSPESFLGKLARAVAQGYWAFQKKLQRISLDTVPNPQSTYDALADYATAYGLSDGDGGFGPLLATAATGLVGTATGSNGSVIADGTQLVAADGTTIFETVNGPYTISGGVASIEFNAITKGTSGNLQVPATLTFISPPVGVSSTVDLTTGTDNGTDKESISHLLDRILERLQNPPKGGTQADWNVWCTLAVTSLDQAYGYARRNGTGTVDEVVTYAPTAAGTGDSRQVSAGDLAAISAYILLVRPVTVEGFRVLTPDMPTDRGLTLRSRIVPYPAGAFDWDDTIGTFTVSGYAAGPPAIVTLNADPGSDFQDAVTAGLQPRLQIVSTNADPINAQVRVTAYNAVTNEATLEDPLPTGFTAPSNGDKIYAGGAAVDTIAAEQLAYVNALGPSRISGYADPNTVWNDTVETEQLARVALDAEDENGDPLAKNIVKVASVPQILISIGAGSPTTNDFETTDNAVDPPECAYVKHIAVTA